MTSSSPRCPSFLLLLCLAATAIISVAATVVDDAAHTLPILFFHGVTSNAKAGYNLQQNLSTDDRPFIALNFCENECSVRDIPTQVTMAIDQIREITSNDSRFDNGYVVIGHSQGGIIARAVIQEMDDHKVHTFISLAGAQNGNFYGPQASDQIPTQVFVKALGPKMLPTSLIDFSNYTAADVASGKMQIDFLKLADTQAATLGKLSVANLLRSPVRTDWIRVNKFLPGFNGFQSSAASVAECSRRKRNFLRLKAAHFFASPADDVISPWQTSLFGQYEDVSNMAKLEKQYTKLKIIPMSRTTEYKQDTYGLRTLDRRGGLHLHQVAGVGHSCWVANSTPNGATEECKFQPVFEKHIYPLLSPLAATGNPNPYQEDVRQHSY